MERAFKTNICADRGRRPASKTHAVLLRIRFLTDRAATPIAYGRPCRYVRRVVLRPGMEAHRTAGAGTPSPLPRQRHEPPLNANAASRKSANIYL